MKKSYIKPAATTLRFQMEQQMMLTSIVKTTGTTTDEVLSTEKDWNPAPWSETAED